MSSGSLKRMATLCKGSCPTVRNRLDDLISLRCDAMEESKENEVKNGE